MSVRKATTVEERLAITVRTATLLRGCRALGVVEGTSRSWSRRYGGGTQTWRFVTDTVDKSFQIYSPLSDIYWFYAPGRGYGSGRTVDFIQADSRADFRRVPRLLRLCHPMDLDIWGRPPGRWRIVGAEDSPEEIEIRLEHNVDNDLTRTLSYDRSLMMCVRQSTFDRGGTLVAQRRVDDVVIRPSPSGLTIPEQPCNSTIN